MYEQKELNLTNLGLWKGIEEDEYGNRTKALKKLTRRRRYHRLDSIDSISASSMRHNTERVLSNIAKGQDRPCSGADWHHIANEIVQTYAHDLLRLLLLLQSASNLPASNYTATRNWVFLVRSQNHAFLLPFLQYPPDLTDETVWERGSEMAKETFARCKYQHTRLLVPGEGAPLSPEEELLRWAVEEVMGGICTVTQAVAFEVERIWLKEFNTYSNSPDGSWEWDKQDEARQWGEGIEELMAWLGWAGEWVRCEEQCAWDEECYIPMWPLKLLVGRRWPPKGKRPPEELPREGPPGDGPSDGSGPPDFGMNDDPYLWEPKCIKAENILL
jgi:hypothetical protein